MSEQSPNREVEAEDPRTGKTVRFTSNGIRGTDSYPANQSNSPLFPGPDGKPYANLNVAEGGDAE